MFRVRRGFIRFLRIRCRATARVAPTEIPRSLHRDHAAVFRIEIELPKAAAFDTYSLKQASEEEIKDYVMTHMAKHKVPRYVDFVDGFPMNAAGKILKYKMRQEAVERHNLENANKIVTA